VFGRFDYCAGVFAAGDVGQCWDAEVVVTGCLLVGGWVSSILGLECVRCFPVDGV
jgi:hypothetical protein